MFSLIFFPAISDPVPTCLVLVEFSSIWISRSVSVCGIVYVFFRIYFDYFDSTQGGLSVRYIQNVTYYVFPSEVQVTTTSRPI